jgi:hypothetical protein
VSGVGKSLYLINPSADLPSYFGAEVFAGCGLPPATSMADLSVATVAALAPSDFKIRLCDEHIAPVDFNSSADFIGITGKVSQWGRMRAIAAEFRRRGKTVIIGGPYASLSPDAVRDHCDILIRGEMEEIAPKIFSDLDAGRWSADYVGTRPDLRTSPVPRFDLYPNDRAMMATVQTSRGCPFECEFCDVSEYLGRKQRHKPVAQVIAELDQLYRLGYRTAFLADDNFTVYRARAKELLAAIRDWNARQTAGRFSFTTQVSIDAAGDEELLSLCADAGLTNVFIGIETPNEESLRAAKKRQNLKKNLQEEIQRFVDFGITVVCGMIVGFDGDDPGIFWRQYEFAMATPVPIFSLGTLVAPAATPLHARLARDGRLVNEGSEIAAAPWSTNIVPKLMTRDMLFNGVRWLCNAIYRPEAFEERVSNLIETFGRRRVLTHANNDPGRESRPIALDAAQMIQKMSRLGPAEMRMFGNVMKMLRHNRAASRHVMGALVQYAQVRYMYEQGHFWEPQLSPDAAAMWRSQRESRMAPPVPVLA